MMSKAPECGAPGALLDAEKRSRHFRLTLALLILLSFAAAFLSLLAGRYGLSPADTLDALLHPEAKTPAASIVWNVRLPRILLAFIAGAGLAASGAAFQALFANPLAAPDTLGVATGASFGAVLAILLGLGAFAIQGLSVLSGLAAIAIVMLVARGQNGESGSILMIVLAGMVVGALFTAFVSIVKFAADPQDVLPSITFWLMGSLTGASIRTILPGLPLLILGGAILMSLRWRLNAASLPKNEAESLGINVRLMRGTVILAATLMTASVVSLCGLIGWLGLLVPHAARLLFGAANERVLPASMVLGGLFLILIDTAARTMAESEIPVSILTALVGAPAFIILMRRAGRPL